MLHLNSAVQRQPLGGHHFKAHGTMFKADTFHELVVKLRTFRINNLLPVGMPDQEILAYYAKEFPWIVRSDGKECSKEGSAVSSWRDWVMKIWASPPAKLITTKEATSRWDICAACPKNRPFSDIEISKEVMEIKKRTFQLRRGIPVPDNLGYCACFGADLPVLTFIENAEKFVVASEGKPDKCWVGQSAV